VESAATPTPSSPRASAARSDSPSGLTGRTPAGELSAAALREVVQMWSAERR
jgi:hypothetical protein